MANEDSNAVGALAGCIAELRAHCPWMGALTHESLVEYLLEEAYEVAETIETDGGDAELKAELGDVLLQVVLHARLAQERSSFDLDDVARGLTAKMIRRNPHVFRPDGSLQESFPATVEEIVRTWDAVKRSEQVLHSGSAHSGRTLPPGPLDGVPGALPALARAQKLLDRAERAGSARRPPGRLTSRRRKRISGTCSSPSRPPPVPGGSTPNAPSAARTAASRRAGRGSAA